jgi:hypothetical protein
LENELLTVTEPGMFFDVECEDYFADPCPEPSLNNSLIGVLLKQSPLHVAAKHPKLSLDPELVEKLTDARCLGSVVHRLALGAGKNYEVLDFANYRTNKAKEARDEARDAGRVPILVEAFKRAEEMAPRIRQAIDDVLLGEAFIPEVVIVWKISTKHGEIWCRAMIDAWCPTLRTAIDVKSTTDASPAALERLIANQGHDTQNAWYTKGLSHLTDAHGRVQFANVFCETEVPYATHAVTIDEAWKSSAWDLCEEAADLFARCLKLNKWPGYPRTTRTLSPPDWLITQRMMRGFARFSLDDRLDI